VNLPIQDLEALFSQAVVAEAKATRTDPDQVATQWALTYADAALAVFERYRPPQSEAPRPSCVLPVPGWQPKAPKRCKSSTGHAPRSLIALAAGKYKAPVYASRAIIEAVGAVNHSFPLDCVLRAALHLRKAEAYARRHEHA
jgi:hypothetical protein